MLSIKNIRNSIILGTAILFGSNFLPIDLLIKGPISNYHFKTENSEFEFTVYPNKGRDISMMEKQFSEFILENPKTNDTILFRTFSKNHLKFWNWRFYYTSNLYDYNLDSNLKEKHN